MGAAKLGAESMTGGTKTEIDVEMALRWAWRDELSKRQTSAAEGIWSQIEEYGQRGGIDPGHGAAQRYSHFGLPDPDAEALERAVAQLDDVVIDWSQSLGAIAGELSGLVSVNDFSKRSSGDSGKVTRAGWTDKRTGKWSEAESRPRDMLMLGAFRTKALVTMYAARGCRPDWREDPPRPYRVQADKGQHAKVVGECEGKNRYSLGSFCPLQWEPSPLAAITARAEYAVWWESLHKVVEIAQLSKFTLLPPRAPAAPWRGETDGGAGDVIHVPPAGPLQPLPLAPRRGRMLSPFRRPGAGPVRYLLEMTQTGEVSQ
jgi:hypothetical protein